MPLVISLLTRSNAFKMVALGSLDDDFTPTSQLDLRGHARWLPDVPNEALSLNASYVPAITRRPPQKYSPLTMLLFGGRHGAHLSKLTMISVWMGEDAQILGIYFTYSVEVDGYKVHSLGRPWPLGRDDRNRVPCDCYYTNECLIDYSGGDCPGDVRVDFPIDGPGGEIISRVDLQSMSCGTFLGFRVRLLLCIRRLPCSLLTEMA